MDYSVPIEQKATITYPTEPGLSLEQSVRLVQRALKHYPHLPFHPEIVHTLRPLCPESYSEQDTARIVELIQNNILTIMQAFHDGSEEERRFYRILQHAYIKKIGTHERVSEYLNIPIKSYYRYLKSAVKALTYQMIKAK